MYESDDTPNVYGVVIVLLTKHELIHLQKCIVNINKQRHK